MCIRDRDTRTEVAVKDLDIGQEDKRNAEKYKPTRTRYFRKFMKHVAVPAHGEFVDVGCGKGRVMMLAAEQGFDPWWAWIFPKTFVRLLRITLSDFAPTTGWLLP